MQDPHEINNEDAVLEMSAEEQAIADKVTGKEVEEQTGDVNLPSDNATEDTNEKETSETSKLAGKYNSIEDLRNGVKNINPDVPDYILNGLNDEALEQYYLDQQKDLSSNGRKHSENKTKDNLDDDENVQEKKDASSPEELWKELDEGFREDGIISEELYEKMNKAGIPDSVIDKYADALQKEQVEIANKIVDLAGGQENFDAMKEWAEDGNISEAELDAISALPYDALLGALEGIKVRYEKANPVVNEAVRLTGGQTTTSGSYRNQSEYIMDVSDSRYGSDKRYTKLVDDKFQNSTGLH